MENFVQITNVTKHYPNHANAINNLSLNISRGKIIGLLGPNGSGKTTLIKMLTGLLVPSSGELHINNEKPNYLTKADVSYLPERTYFQDNLKISELISFFEDFYENFRKDVAYEMLKNLDISPSDRFKTLSKGTKEKVQLILVMSRDAQLFILDEPIAGVDPAARDYILKTIITNYNENATIILSTHLISDIENILDEVIFIKNGDLVLHSSVESLREELGKSITW